jgi:pseudouridine-5'-phosphate glycosidase
MNPFLEISPSVNEALQSGQPVVALESTIISHGMPYPENVETALLVEKTVRDNGAVPASIAILGGKMKAGLSVAEIEFLGKAGRGVAKVSRRDLPFLLANGQPGATTVATTMLIAEMAGIRIFATGGIGGVHRGAAVTMDISADLQELARTSVAVVCAGAKSILDLGLTLEYLETHGVPVIGYQTDEFPAFYTRSSGFGVDCRLDSPNEIAKVLKTKWLAGLSGGAIVANPIPTEHEPLAAPIQAATEQALADMQRLGITGKEVSPFLLGKIKELTGGESLRANIELVLNNARLAAKVAVEMRRF